MKTTEPSRRASEQSSRLLLFRAVLGLMIAAANAPAATLLEEYVPLHVGDHYTELVEGRTNTILVQAGVAAFPGSVTEVTIIPVDGTKQTNFEYAGYSGNDVVNYGQDVGTNFALVFAPPLVTMSESALSSLGARFSGSTSWTNAVPGEPAIFTVESETISGMVNSTGTVSVAAGTFPNCLAVVQTVTTITSESILGMNYSSTNTTKQTLFFAPNVGCVKGIENGTNFLELIGGVIGGVTIGGGGGPIPPTLSFVPGKHQPGSFVLELSGTSGQTYWMQTSTDLTAWTTVSTNILSSSSASVTNPAIAGARRQFWRVVWPR